MRSMGNLASVPANTQIMESGRGSRGGCRHSRALGTQSCYLQGALLVVVIFTIHVQRGASQRTESVISMNRDGYVPWNKTLYKTERNCTDFRIENASSYFFYWPEADPAFDFCCAVNTSEYDNFTYGENGTLLQHMTYYDLGVIDDCLPYWKCLHLFERMRNFELYMINCEFTDLTNFYKRRFFYDTMLKRGLLQSAIPFILIAEISVLVSVAVYWLIRRRNATMDMNVLRVATNAWQLVIRMMVLKDWTHLCLLAIIGNGLIDAMGRQRPPTGSQSKMFFNYGRLYLVLSILVWFSTVLHQISIYIAELEFTYDAARRADSGWANIGWLQRHLSESVALENEIGLAADWKWQPIGAQAGILFCLWGYLTFAPDNDTTGAVFGIIVSAACPWSGLYASKVIVHTFPWILVRVYQNIFKADRAEASQRSHRELYARAIELRNEGSHVQLNDSDSMHELADRSTSPV